MQNDHTPLVDAVRADQHMIVRLLLKAGADTKAQRTVSAATAAGHVP